MKNNGLNLLMRLKPSGVLPKRIALQILVVSSIVTFFLAGAQIYSEWRLGISKREQSLAALETSFVPQLSRAVWSTDTEQLDLILIGIANATNANYIFIQDVSDQPPIVWGTLDAGQKIERQFQLTTTIGDTKKTVGTLLVQAELGSFYSELKSHLVDILIKQFIKTFLVTFAIMVIIQLTVSSHLVRIAEAAEESSNNLTDSKAITLDRAPNTVADELDKVVLSINRLQKNMQDSLAQIKTQSDEKIAMQEELIDATQRASVTQTVSGVLHDVNNLLSLIAAHMPLLEDQMEDLKESLPADKYGKLAAVVSKVTQSTNAAVEVANLHMRTFSLTSDAEMIELDSIIDSVLAIQQNFLSKHEVNVQYASPTGYRCYAMQGAVVTILINLLKNAVEALSQSGFSSNEKKQITLSVRSVSEPKYTTISVSDNGPGISEAAMTRLFESGFSTKKDGHGIGLNFCRNLAQRLGGNLTASSLGIGTGSTFYLTLPSEPGASLAAKPTPIKFT